MEVYRIGRSSGMGNFVWASLVPTTSTTAVAESWWKRHSVTGKLHSGLHPESHGHPVLRSRPDYLLLTDRHQISN